MDEMDGLAEATADIVRSFVAAELERRDRLIAEQGAAIASLKAQLSSLPTPRDGTNGRDGERGPAGKDGANGKDGERGADGKSADPEQVEALAIRLVAKAVDAIPKPRDGTNGRDGRDGESPALELVVAKLLAQMPKPENGKDGAAGRDGKDAPAVDLDQVVTRFLAAVPTPKDGKDGVNGKDGVDGRHGKDAEAVDIDALAARVLSAVPAPKDGRDGIDGKDGAHGKDGAPGRDGLDGKDGAKGLDGKDGAPGVDGTHGKDGAPGRDGTNGRDGVDGKNVEASDVERAAERALEPRVASWALDFERRAQAVLASAVNAIPLPRDGRDGKDGAPGVGLDAFEFNAAKMADGRTVEFTLRANGREQRESITLDVPIDRGVFRKGQHYDAGDAVTYGGQLYLAQRATVDTTPGESGDWRLAVKRGRDGKDAAE